MLLAPKWLAGFSGQFVDAWGYEAFFTSTALLGLPVLLLVWLAGRQQRFQNTSHQEPISPLSQHLNE